MQNVGLPVPFCVAAYAAGGFAGPRIDLTAAK